MSEKYNFIWKFIKVICWLTFIGYCLETGVLLSNFMYSFYNPIATHDLYLGLDLSDLYNKSKHIYTSIFLLAIAIAALKAYIFFFTIMIFKKINLVKPFSQDISLIIAKITYFTFSVGILSELAQIYTGKLIEKGFDVGIIERFWNDGESFLMMSAIVFVIALVFNKGIELQNENELTV